MPIGAYDPMVFHGVHLYRQAPVFPEVGFDESFAVSIYENVSVGAEVFTASATDLDTVQ